MYTITDKSTKKSITVHCAGNFNAESCVALKDALSGAFKKVAPAVILNLSQTEGMDLANLQVIISASKTAQSCKKDFVLDEPIPELIKRRLTAIGCSSLIVTERLERVDGN